MIRNNSVCICLRIVMELHGVRVIFLLGVIGLAEVVDGLCLVRNTTDPDYYRYQCFMSTDYTADLKKAPVDIKGHSVFNSKIPVLRNGAFTRFAESLDSLGIIFCGIREIEDNAFQGLTQLIALILAGNRLEVLKSAWVKGLSKLEVLSLQNNQIKRVDDDFFSVLPRNLNGLQILDNRLTCLPTAPFGNFNATDIDYRNSCLTWKCQMEVREWLKNTHVRDYSQDIENMEPPCDLADICVSKPPQSRKDEELLEKCVEDKTRALLPLDGDYTVRQVCKYLEREPSPFFNCTQ